MSIPSTNGWVCPSCGVYVASGELHICEAAHPGLLISRALQLEIENSFLREKIQTLQEEINQLKEKLWTTNGS
jgi:hypothetical protein